MSARALTGAGIAVLAFLSACVAGDAEAVRARASTPPATSASVLADAIPDSTFARLVQGLSEPGGYFDTDNLISNESSYLHVLGALRARGLGGGAYVGVGPDQSFSYIAALRPELAFIVDIRRDNVLQHLLFKAIFAVSGTRAAYLANLVGAALPTESDGAGAVDASGLVAVVDGARRDDVTRADARARVDAALASLPVTLEPADLATARRFHDAFLRDGLELRFQSHGRAPRPYYPTLRRLLVETDREGRQGSYLASEDAYRFVRDLQAANRVIPVVGDLAGPAALRRVGEEVRRRGLGVTAFYTSNVEYYLWQGRSFERFVANVGALPWATDGVLIRSVFPGPAGGHPLAVPGYYSTQTLQPAAAFLDAARSGGFRGYQDLVTRDAVGAPPP